MLRKDIPSTNPRSKLILTKILKHQNPDSIEVMRTDYKKLLNFENWQDFYKGKNQEKIQNDAKNIHEKITKIYSQIVY